MVWGLGIRGLGVLGSGGTRSPSSPARAMLRTSVKRE